MSFLTYLCWLLGISAPTECDANSYQAWQSDGCATVEEGKVDATGKEEGQHNDAPRHNRANINVSI